MSIYRARLSNTSNALSPQVSSEQIRLQVPPKDVRVPDIGALTQITFADNAGHVGGTVCKPLPEWLNKHVYLFQGQITDRQNKDRQSVHSIR